MWMILACLANASSLPVTRSSNRTPKANSRSQSRIAQLAYTLPCMPSMSRHNGSSLGNAPSPMTVMATGMPVLRAKIRSSSLALAETMPPPQYSTGRLASLIAAATCLICSRRARGGIESR